MMRALAPALSLALAACGGPTPEWDEPEAVRLYEKALSVLHEEIDEPDTLFVDANPRFLIRTEDGAHQMGDFNRYGDPAFTAAIASMPLAAPCRRESGQGCSRTDPAGYAVLSEVLPIRSREAVLLATHLDLAGEQERVLALVIQFRFGSGGWRVTRVQEIDPEGVHP